MSLEIALQENTSAIRDLIARLTSTGPTAVAMTAAAYVETIDAARTVVTKSPDLDAAADKIEAAAEVEDAKLKAAIIASKVESPKPAATPDVIATPAQVEAVAASPSEQPATIDYAKDVKPLLLKVSTSKGRDALVALLAQFGVGKC